jgi:hypothetical protein
MIGNLEVNYSEDNLLDDDEDKDDTHEEMNDITKNCFQYPYEVPFVINNINHNQMEKWDLTLDTNHSDYFGNDTSTLGHYFLCQRNILKILEVVKYNDILFYNPKNLEECRYYFENFIDNVIEPRKHLSYFYFLT